MRIRALALVLAIITVAVTACSTSPTNPEPQRPMVANGVPTGCSYLPVARSDIDYTMHSFGWDLQQPEPQLMLSGTVKHIPKGYGVWAFLVKDNVCWRFAFGPWSNLLSDTGSDTTEGFGFGAKTSIPNIYASFAAEVVGQHCPIGSSYDSLASSCKSLITEGYRPLIVVTTPEATKILAGYVRSPKSGPERVNDFPQGSYNLIPRNIVTSRRDEQ